MGATLIAAIIALIAAILIGELRLALIIGVFLSARMLVDVIAHIQWRRQMRKDFPS